MFKSYGRNGLFKSGRAYKWYFNDELHNEDGPAMRSSRGDKRWFLNGIEYTEEEFIHWYNKQAVNEILNEKLVPKLAVKRHKI